MSECRRVRKNLVAFLSGELGGAEREKVSRHVRGCSLCGRELDRLREMLRCAESLNPEMEKTLASVDWDALSEKIVAAVWQGGSRPAERSRRQGFRLLLPKFKPVLAGLLLGVLVGAAAMYLVLRQTSPLGNGGEKFFASREFLDNVDLEIARRETLDYLERSQYVLLEFAEPGPGGGKFGSEGLAAEQARELLEKKKFLNPQLEKARMAKAKEICDQIELLFYELAQVSESLTDQQRREIQDLIAGKKLLLKIKLLKKELQESEV
jgi:hypothetical protein